MKPRSHLSHIFFMKSNNQAKHWQPFSRVMKPSHNLVCAQNLQPRDKVLPTQTSPTTNEDRTDYDTSVQLLALINGQKHVALSKTGQATHFHANKVSATSLKLPTRDLPSKSTPTFGHTQGGFFSASLGHHPFSTHRGDFFQQAHLIAANHNHSESQLLVVDGTGHFPSSHFTVQCPAYPSNCTVLLFRTLRVRLLLRQSAQKRSESLTCSSVVCLLNVSASRVSILRISLLTWYSCSFSRVCSSSTFSCRSCDGIETSYHNGISQTLQAK